MISNPWTKEPIHSVIRFAVKAPLVILLGKIDGLLPEPTRETVMQRNTKLLVDIKDAFFQHYIGGKDRGKALSAIWKLVIIVYDYDPPYQHMMNWILEEVVKRIGEWQPRPDHEPDNNIWKHEI